MPHFVALRVYERVTKKATRSSSEKRDWIVQTRSGDLYVNEVFGDDEKAARAFYRKMPKAPKSKKKRTKAKERT